eukprot:12977634-Alexandrium_andersonii.AAC.1
MKCAGPPQESCPNRVSNPHKVSVLSVSLESLQPARLLSVTFQKLKRCATTTTPGLRRDY